MLRLARWCFDAAGKKLPVDHHEAERVEAALADAVARARQEWPDVPVDEAAFARLVGQRLSADPAPAAAIDRLKLMDLCLVSACLAGSDAAVAAFARTYRPEVDRSLRGRRGGKDLADEIWQSLFTHLFVGRESVGPRLATYTGFSPLKGFVGISAQRLLASDGRATQARQRLERRLSREPAPVDRGPELSLVRHQYRRPFEVALRAVVADLPQNDRSLLDLHLGMGVSMPRIATMFRVGQATISRRLSRIRKAVWADLSERLCRELNLDTDELDSITRAVASQIDAAVSVVLKAESAKKPRT